MGARIPMRDVIGSATPQRLYEFGDKIAESLQKEDALKREAHVSSGLISGGKLGQPTLWAVLDMIGIPRDFDPYLLGKFKRGNDVEARAINMLTGIPVQKIMDILESSEESEWIKLDDNQLLGGEVKLQLKAGYRGGTGFVDLAQRNNGTIIYHEIKSATKMAYDRVAASGRYKGEVNVEKEIGVPYYHHCQQLAYYCLGDEINTAFLHYFNADDYRLTTFVLNPLDYKEEIDKEIDDIQEVFITKELPAWEGFLGYHKAYMKSTYPDWNTLSPDEMMDKLERQYPEQHKKFLEVVLPV